jgi:SPP1 family predicted phage head-tail adaptor
MPGAGVRQHMVAFDSLDKQPNGIGGTSEEWVERFRSYAEFKHLRGGEAVMAARLSGRHTQLIIVRSTQSTREVTTDWRARDVRTGEAYNIRDVTPENNRAYITLLCERGVA